MLGWLAANLPGFLSTFKQQTGLSECDVLGCLEVATNTLHNNLHSLSRVEGTVQ